MGANRLYYELKPYLPWRLRMALRRALARNKRQKWKDVWPIDEVAARRPEGWTGWPGGKRFAFVLTHDVEGPKGLARCRDLMQLEQKLGFRSSFNLIPEGDYTVPPATLAELAERGFEIGVHDLHHDGKLYQTHTEFSKHARHINRYLEQWGARGFRSGFMHHRLDWLHELNIQYDSSTFDTDPFEPQPDGATTIFPFWVHGPNGGGYVELPYTLPQDLTLFLVLQEQGPSTWKKKLDWIVERGGMALLDVHPDYLNFGGQKANHLEYPATWYEEFLKYVTERYGEVCWNAQPHEVAAWFRKAHFADGERKDSTPASATYSFSPMPGPNKGRKLEPVRAAVVLYSYYAFDPRPRRAAEALVRAGMQVDVICLRRSFSLPRYESLNGVNILRLPLKRRRSSKLTYGLQYLWFLVASTWVLSVWSLKRRYRLVHIHNMPDILAFSGFLPRLRGAKIILDLHDPMPELFRSIYGFPAEHFFVRFLKRLEKTSINFADLVLTPNIAFRDLFISRSCPPEKIHVVMNSPQARVFDASRYNGDGEKPTADRPFTLMYHGLLADRHGLDYAVHAVAQLRARIPNLRLLIYGTPTTYMDEILRLIQQLGLPDVIQYRDFRPVEEIARAIGAVDLGLIPNRLDPFTQINLPTRIFEYLAMNKPVIVPRTKGIQDYFKDDEMLFFEPGNSEDLARKIEWVYHHPSETQDLVARGRKVYEQHLWESEERHFVSLAQSLVGKGATAVPRARPAGPRRVCMISYSTYESDNRVMRYAEALAERGDLVDVVSLKWNVWQLHAPVPRGIHVHRLQQRSKKNQHTKEAYLLPLLRFWLVSSGWLTWKHLRHRYDLVHVHNVPDFLVFAAWLPKLTGAKIILDIHDMVPEFYASKFHLRADSFGVKALKRVERASAGFADHIIISNHLWQKTFVSRSAPEKKCSVFINQVNRRVFYHRPTPAKNGKTIIMFPGGLQWHQGLDIAIRAFGTLAEKLPRAEFHIYGDGNMKDELLSLTRDLCLTEKVRFFDALPVSQIAEVMSTADLGVVPKRADSFGNEAYSTKIMEFMSLGVPVVVSSTKIDRYYFDASIVRFFESGNPEALAETMLEVLRDEEPRRRMVALASEHVSHNNWDIGKDDYLKLIDTLCSASRNGTGEPR